MFRYPVRVWRTREVLTPRSKRYKPPLISKSQFEQYIEHFECKSQPAVAGSSGKSMDL